MLYRKERKKKKHVLQKHVLRIKHVYGGPTHTENGEVIMDSSTSSDHQQTEGRVDGQRVHVIGAQIDNGKGVQVDDGLYDIERRAQINSGQTDTEGGVQVSSGHVDNEGGVQHDSNRGVQVGDESRKNAQLCQQQHSSSLTDQSIESIHDNDPLALADDDFNYETTEDPKDDIDWEGSVSLDVSAISNSSTANSFLVPDDYDVSMDTPSVALDEAFTCPEPANWTFSQDFPELTDISISDIGMDTEQVCVTSAGSEERVDAFRALQNSLQTCSSILEGWFILPNCRRDVIQLCTHETNRVGSPVISFTIEIMQNCQWCLRIPQGVINWKTNPVLKELSSVITTPDDVKEVVETINYSKRCRGINEEKFNPLLTKHNGRFFDRSGKLK